MRAPGQAWRGTVGGNFAGCQVARQDSCHCRRDHEGGRQSSDCRNRANAADKAEREQGKTDETKTATVTPINDAKSVKTVKADANKVAKGAPVKPALSAVPEVEEAQWEPPTDRDVTDGLGTITDSVKHVAKMIDYFTALKAPASMIMERVEILNKIIEDIGKLGQDVRQIMIGAELDTDDAKSTKVKKAQ
jgi:hypothetical protein